MELYKVTNFWYDSPYSFGKYRYSYKIGTIVTAIPKTLGIILFDNIEDAIEFKGMKTLYNRLLIVEPLDSIVKPYKVSNHLDPYLFDEFYKTDNSYGIDPPTGTVCCSSVKVIREIADRDMLNINKIRRYFYD